MQLLKTYHGSCCSLFIEMVIVRVVLFQWQYQSLHPAMGFGLWVSSVNLGVGGHCNSEQLVSPDHHPMHLKRVAVFHKSTILLCLIALMVMSPDSLVAFTDPFQLSLSPETVFAEPTGSSYPLLVLLPGGLHGHFICVWGSDAVPEVVSISELTMSSLDESESDEDWSLVLLKLPTAVPSSGSVVTLFGLEGGLVGSCSCCLKPSFQYQFGHVLIILCRAVFTPSFNLLGVDMGPLIAMIIEWTAGRVVSLFVWGWQETQQMGPPPGKCLHRGYLVG